MAGRNAAIKFWEVQVSPDGSVRDRGSREAQPQHLQAGTEVAPSTDSAQSPAPTTLGAGRTSVLSGTSRNLDFVSKSTRNTGTRWSSSDQRTLRDLARQNTPTRVIGLKLGRTEGAVQSQASPQGVSLKPTNQSPYNRRSK